jgi:hypothetical protein
MHITRYVTMISITSFKVALLNTIGCDMIWSDGVKFLSHQYELLVHSLSITCSLHMYRSWKLEALVSMC